MIKNSESEFLTNANTDDLIAPQAYSTLIEALNTNAAGLAYSDWYVTTVPNQLWPPRADSVVSCDYMGAITPESNCGHFPLWRRSLHYDLGLFDQNFLVMGDADWWARCYHLGKIKFIKIKQPLGSYLDRRGSNLATTGLTTTELDHYHQKVQRYLEAS